MTEKYHKEYLSRLLGLLQENNGKMFVAVYSNQITGAIAGIIEPKDEDNQLTNRCPKRGKVLELIVSDKNRSSGIGTALLQTMEAYFRQQSCEFVAVDVFAPNEKALAFYENNNYFPRNIEIYKRLREE